jgi:hypothetical protein
MVHDSIENKKWLLPQTFEIWCLYPIDDFGRPMPGVCIMLQNIGHEFRGSSKIAKEFLYKAG